MCRIQDLGTNSENPFEAAHDELPHLDLCCLQIQQFSDFFFGASGVKCIVNMALNDLNFLLKEFQFVMSLKIWQSMAYMYIVCTSDFINILP